MNNSHFTKRNRGWWSPCKAHAAGFEPSHNVLHVVPTLSIPGPANIILIVQNSPKSDSEFFQISHCVYTEIVWIRTHFLLHRSYRYKWTHPVPSPSSQWMFAVFAILCDLIDTPHTCSALELLLVCFSWETGNSVSGGEFDDAYCVLC